MSIIGNGIVLGAGGATASIYVTGLRETNTVTASKDGKTVIGKWTQIPNPVAHVLPDGYTELEYIENSGTQYIDTGIADSHDISAIAKFNCTVPASGEEDFIGNYNTTNQQGFASGFYGGGRAFLYDGIGGLGGNINTGSAIPSGDFVFEISITDSLVKMIINGASYEKSKSGHSSSNSNVYIFSGGNAYYVGKFKMKSCEISVSQVKVRDFIPVKRNSDNAIGMYDLVTKAFFENAGTGTFTAGPEIPQTIDGFLIDKIKSYGTWTVTATDGTNTATQDVLVDVIAKYEIEMSYRNIDKNIVLLIDGNNIEDISTYQRAITNNGVTLSNAQTKFFDKSLYFNGSAILQFDAYTLGTGNFTIDFWMYNTSTSNAYRRWITGNNGYFVDGTFCIRESGDGPIQTHNVTSSTSVPRNQWVHIAAVKSNGTLKIYLNGTEIASITDSTNYSEALKYIGGYASSIGNETFQGYMDEIRVSNIARWTSNFTPPTRPY